MMYHMISSIHTHTHMMYCNCINKLLYTNYKTFSLGISVMGACWNEVSSLS